MILLDAIWPYEITESTTDSGAVTIRFARRIWPGLGFAVIFLLLCVTTVLSLTLTIRWMQPQAREGGIYGLGIVLFFLVGTALATLMAAVQSLMFLLHRTFIWDVQARTMTLRQVPLLGFCAYFDEINGVSVLSRKMGGIWFHFVCFVIRNNSRAVMITWLGRPTKELEDIAEKYMQELAHTIRSRLDLPEANVSRFDRGVQVIWWR
ncbi:MAG TPA: hypothetical protein VGJ26_16230 [Pirellulales bacterium]|jgi:hypothetical protein